MALILSALLYFGWRPDSDSAHLADPMGSRESITISTLSSPPVRVTVQPVATDDPADESSSLDAQFDADELMDTLGAGAGAEAANEAIDGDGDSGREQALAWIREVWSVDEFVRWVRTSHPGTDKPPFFRLAEEDARFAHECVTYILAGQYDIYLNGDKGIQDREAAFRTDSSQSTAELERYSANLRTRRAGYVALFSVLPELQRALESGIASVELQRVALSSGRYSTAVSGGFVSMYRDAKKQLVSYKTQAGSWKVRLVLPASMFDAEQRALIFPPKPRAR